MISARHDEILQKIAVEADRIDVSVRDLMERILWLGWHCYLDDLANESEDS